ncbi:MAG: glycogen debranching protein, partial [Okeania sp. SIO2D1]|nr:glycogen debranching protein [Okeania sp. SIO2D1]
GYHWFGDWGRDTMISLPGLAIATGRLEVAREILRTFSHYVDQGMLPNRFPDGTEEPEYNSVDAPLTYFEAIRAYYQVTSDRDFLVEIFPVLAEIIACYCRGTRYNIYLDHHDGLIYAGQKGTQLTWLDATVGDWVVTPRQGKPIEVNAYWYNALAVMVEFAQILDKSAQEYQDLKAKTAQGFGRFWYEIGGYCYDVIDGSDGKDTAMRPNQIFAVSLPVSPLTDKQQKGVVENCARFLLTSHGLRSLAPHNAHYTGNYGGSPLQRDGAYHQGTVWGWLIGHFAIAHYRVFRNAPQALSFLEPMANHLAAHGVGSLSEIFDGVPPHSSRGCIAQAWTVGEVLRAWKILMAI